MKIEYLKGTNVISIAPLRAETNFPSISRVESYWEGLRNGRVMPARADVDPRGISSDLEYAFILEKVAPGLARIRLGGMHLNDLMAMEVRGMPITAMFLPESRREMQRILESVLESPAVVRLTLASDSGMTRPQLEAQMILLPLKDEEGRATRILGAIQAKGTIGRGPRRFNIVSSDIKPIMEDEALPARHTPKTHPALEELNAEIKARQDKLDPRPILKAIKDATLTGNGPKLPQPKAKDTTGEATGAPRHLRLVHDADEA